MYIVLLDAALLGDPRPQLCARRGDCRVVQKGVTMLRSPHIMLHHMLLLSPLFMQIIAIDGAQCYDGESSHVSVTNSSDASDLADTLLCSSSARLTIDWYGQIDITRTLVIRNSNEVEIQGSEGAVISGGGDARLFTATGGAILGLRNISLVGGFASGEENGGAILANESARILLEDCSLEDNNANRHGGEYGCL